jgi:hypothetical protein
MTMAKLNLLLYKKFSSIMKLFFTSIICLMLLSASTQVYSQKQKECPQPGDSYFETYFTDIAKAKLEDLGFILTIISDKQTEVLVANAAIDNAVKMFINEDALVQVSSVNNTNIEEYKIRNYLKRVKALKYDKIIIEWGSIQYVSELRLGDDGNYHGIISYQQKFTGISEGNIKYEDFVKKHTEIIVTPQKVESQGTTVICWQAYLSDIKVIQTMRP